MDGSRPEQEPYEEKNQNEQYEREPAVLTETGPSPAKINTIVNYIFRIVEGLIFIRILLKALGGNPANGFVTFIYTITQPFVTPFLTVFNVPVISTSIGVIELGSVISIFFFMLLNYAIVRLVLIITSRR